MLIVKYSHFRYSVGVANESTPHPRFGYLRGNGNYQPRRPEDKSTYDKVQELARSGQIQPETKESLAKKQIERHMQNPSQQAEHYMRRKGHRVKERKHRKRIDPPASLYERRFFGIEE